jgi:hypothetical protein
VGDRIAGVIINIPQSAQIECWHFYSWDVIELVVGIFQSFRGDALLLSPSRI